MKKIDYFTIQEKGNFIFSYQENSFYEYKNKYYQLVDTYYNDDFCILQPYYKEITKEKMIEFCKEQKEDLNKNIVYLDEVINKLS